MGSFRQGVAALVPALRRYARALTRDAELADDLVQDTLVRALPNTMSGSFGSGAAIPYSWMLAGCQSWNVI